MLPPSDDYESGNGNEYPFDRDDYPSGLFEDYEMATEAYDSLSEYMHNNGFSNDEWFNMLTDIDNIWYDDDGNIHFDFEWESGDGEYSGSGSV